MMECRQPNNVGHFLRGHQKRKRVYKMASLVDVLPSTNISPTYSTLCMYRHEINDPPWHCCEPGRPVRLTSGIGFMSIDTVAISTHLHHSMRICMDPSHRRQRHRTDQQPQPPGPCIAVNPL